MAAKPLLTLSQAEKEMQKRPIGEYNANAKIREQMASNHEFSKIITGLSNENAVKLRARLAAEKLGLTKTPNYEMIQKRMMENPKSIALLMAAKRGNFGLREPHR